MFDETTNMNKFCIGTGDPVLGSGKNVTGGLVAARSLVTARGLWAALGWVGGPRGRLYYVPVHLYALFLTLQQVSSLCTRYRQSVLLPTMLALRTVLDSW